MPKYLTAPAIDQSSWHEKRGESKKLCRGRAEEYRRKNENIIFPFAGR